MGYAIRCKVDGVQQMARTLSKMESKGYDELLKNGNAESIRIYKAALAGSYFPESQSIGEEQTKGMRRCIGRKTRKLRKKDAHYPFFR